MPIGKSMKPSRITQVAMVSPTPERTPGRLSATFMANGMMVATPQPAAANPIRVDAVVGQAIATAIPTRQITDPWATAKA